MNKKALLLAAFLVLTAAVLGAVTLAQEAEEEPPQESFWGIGVKFPPLAVFASLNMDKSFSTEAGLVQMPTYFVPGVLYPVLGAYLNVRFHLKEMEFEPLPCHSLRPYIVIGLFTAPTPRTGTLMGGQGYVGMECSFLKTPFTAFAEAGFQVATVENVLVGGPDLNIGFCWNL